MGARALSGGSLPRGSRRASSPDDARGSSAWAGSPPAGGRSHRAPRARSAVLARGDLGAAPGGWDQALRRRHRVVARADGGMGCGAASAAISLFAILIPSGSCASSAGASGRWRATCWRRCSSASRRMSRAVAVMFVLDRVSGSLADFLTGGSDPNGSAAARGGRRIRLLARCQPLVVSLSPPVRRAAPARAPPCGTCERRLAAPSGRRVVRAGGDVVAAVRHAQAARDWLVLPGCSPTTISISRSMAARDCPRARRRVSGRHPGGRSRAGSRVGYSPLLDGAPESAAHIELAQRLADVVPEERRPSFDVKLAEMKLLLARWRATSRPCWTRAKRWRRRSQPSARAWSPSATITAPSRCWTSALPSWWSARLDDAQRDLQTRRPGSSSAKVVLRRSRSSVRSARRAGGHRLRFILAPVLDLLERLTSSSMPTTAIPQWNERASSDCSHRRLRSRG